MLSKGADGGDTLCLFCYLCLKYKTTMGNNNNQLTIADIQLLNTFIYVVKYNKTGACTIQQLTKEQCEEVLNRFNAAKQRE